MIVTGEYNLRISVPHGVDAPTYRHGNGSCEEKMCKMVNRSAQVNHGSIKDTGACSAGQAEG